MYSNRSPESRQLDLQQQQYAFTGWIRDPDHSAAIEDVAASRMALYRELFFNNFVETLNRAFPVLQQVLDKDHWQRLCQRFFAEHHCHTPYLSQLPGEFVQFLQQQPIDPPWMLELAQWEWAELELFLAPDPEAIADLGADPLEGIPLLTSLLRLQVCHYPVHRISVDYLPEHGDDTLHYLLAWRKPDDSIGFMALNALSAHIIQLMRNNLTLVAPYSGLQLLSMIAEQYSEYDAEAIINGGRELLVNLYRSNIIAGSLTAAFEEPHP